MGDSSDSVKKASSGILSLSTVGTWGWTVLCVCVLGGRPVHCRVFNSIPGRYPLDAGGIHPSLAPQS